MARATGARAAGDGQQRTRVSVVIPTLNAGPRFVDLLEAIRAQRGPYEVDVVVVDSGSTDGTAEVAERFGATLRRIDRSEFDHGETRDLGISLSRGEYVVLTVQDAVPIGDGWLAALVENLQGDGLVAGVCGRQVPNPGAGPLTRVLVGNMATASTERQERFAGGPEEFRALPPRKRRRLSAFDNVSSCLRRSVWESIPFGHARFGEDMQWGKRVMEAGYKTVYEPRSAVLHSHERGALYDIRRYYVDQRLLLDLFGLVLIPSPARLPLAIARTAAHLFGLLRGDEELRSLGAVRLALLAIAYAVPSQVGSFLGARSDAVARLSPRLHAYLSRGV